MESAFRFGGMIWYFQKADGFLKDFNLPGGFDMIMKNFPFEVTDWDKAEGEEHKGETGTARWKTRTFGEIRVRMVEYSPGYAADHWCTKGHVVLCLEGELQTEGKDGRKQLLTPGMTYQVADDDIPHRSRTDTGVKLFIVD
jgi:hypothetical protein